MNAQFGVEKDLILYNMGALKNKLLTFLWAYYDWQEMGSQKMFFVVRKEEKVKNS